MELSEPILIFVILALIFLLSYLYVKFQGKNMQEELSLLKVTDFLEAITLLRTRILLKASALSDQETKHLDKLMEEYFERSTTYLSPTRGNFEKLLRLHARPCNNTSLFQNEVMKSLASQICSQLRTIFVHNNHEVNNRADEAIEELKKHQLPCAHTRYTQYLRDLSEIERFIVAHDYNEYSDVISHIAILHYELRRSHDALLDKFDNKNAHTRRLCDDIRMIK